MNQRTRRQRPRGRVRLSALLAILATLVMASGLTMLSIAPSNASGGDDEQVCSGLDSGKIDVSGDQLTVTVTAPEGMLISGYCVKAGSTYNGDGPHYAEVSPPQKSITLSYTSVTGQQRAISHYSLSYVEAGSSATEVAPDVVFHNPSCEDETASWKGLVDGEADAADDGVTFAVTAGSVAPGASVTVTASAEAGFVFAGGVMTKEFSHTFGEVPEDCAVGGEELVAVSPSVTFENPTCEMPSRATWQGTHRDVIQYTLVGTAAPSETVTVLAELKASAAGQYELAADARTSWTHTFRAPPTCVLGEETSVGSSSGGGSFAPATTQSGLPTVIAAGTAGTPSARADRAPQLMLLLGMLLFAGSLMVLGRRPRGAHAA